MHIIIFRLIWPYLARYLMSRGAEYTAGFLHSRRMWRLQQQAGEQELQETIEPALPDELDLDEVAEILCPPAEKPFFASDAFWFTLSGVLLGTAFGIIVSYVTRQDD